MAARLFKAAVHKAAGLFPDTAAHAAYDNAAPTHPASLAPSAGEWARGAGAPPRRAPLARHGELFKERTVEISSSALSCQ